MTFVVPFDGSPLSEAAYLRAGEFARALDESLVAVSVVPASKRYAVEKGWIDEAEAFVVRDVIADLHRQATDLAPDGSFQAKQVDSAAREGSIALTIRRTAIELGASIVFLGSENAGRIVVPVSSVGGSVAAEEAYDVHIVRHRRPPKIGRLGERSEFFLSE